MLKILQARFQQYVNRELPDVQAGLSLNQAVYVLRYYVPPKKVSNGGHVKI